MTDHSQHDNDAQKAGRTDQQRRQKRHQGQDQCGAHDAAAASLENVKRRNLEAAEAWEAMADRLERTNAHRDANEAAREARAI